MDQSSIEDYILNGESCRGVIREKAKRKDRIESTPARCVIVSSSIPQYRLASFRITDPHPLTAKGKTVTAVC